MIGDRNKILERVDEVSSKEGTDVDYQNTNKCNIRVVKLFVVDKGVSKEGVATCFKITKNQNGLVCCELNLYQ